MDSIEQSIEVDAPVHLVYTQWAHFENFPQFMQGVERVTRLDDTRLHWVVRVGGKNHEWDAEIFDQVLDRRIAWRSVSGRQSQGAVYFDKTSATSTRVRAIISYIPERVEETASEDTVGVASAQVRSDLQRFKKFIEEL